MPSVDVILTRCNRDKRFRSLATAFLNSLRLARLLDAELAKKTPVVFPDLASETPRILEELRRRADLPDDCSLDRMGQIVQDLILPLLQEAKAKKPEASKDQKKKLSLDRKVNVGFAQVSPAIPLILMGDTEDVRAALAVVVEAQCKAHVLRFSHEPQTEDDWYRHEGSHTHILAPQWHVLAHSRKTMRVTMEKIEAEQGDEPFEMLVVDDVGLRPANYSSSGSYLSRAFHACSQLLYWAKHRGTALIAGLHKRADRYSAGDMQALSGFCEVWHLSRDDDDDELIVADSMGGEHVVGA